MLDEIMFAFIFFDKAAIKSEVCRLERMLNGVRCKIDGQFLFDWFIRFLQQWKV